MKYMDQDIYFENKLNKNLIKDFQNIILKKDLFMTFIYYGYLKPIIWLNKNVKFNLNDASTLAIERGHLDILKYLFKKGYRIAYYDLITIVKNNYFDILIYCKSVSNLLEMRYGYNMGIYKKLLLISLHNRNLEIFKYIIDLYSNKDNNYNNIITRILPKAAKSGSYKIVKLLLEEGANINSFNYIGYDIHNPNNIKYLRKQKMLWRDSSDEDTEDDDNYFESNALVEASRSNNYEIVKLLLENKAKIYIEAFKGFENFQRNNKINITTKINKCKNKINKLLLLYYPNEDIEILLNLLPNLRNDL